MHGLFKIIVLLPVFQESMQNQLEVGFVFVLDVLMAERSLLTRMRMS